MTRRYVKRPKCGIEWWCPMCQETHACVRRRGHKSAHCDRQDVVLDSVASAYGCTWDGQLAMRYPRPDEAA